jgi:hypothetical protein
MQSKLVFVTLSLTCAAAVASLVNSRLEQQRSKQEMTRLEASIEGLKADRQSAPVIPVGSDRRAVALAAAAPAGTAAGQETESAPEERQPEDARREPREPPMTYEQSQTNVLAAFVEEAPDARWSGDATRKLDAITRSNLPSGSRVNSIECRTTMCQMEVTHTDPVAHSAFLMEGFRGWPGSIFVAGETERGGELVVSLIAAREGTEPPLGPR